MTKLTHPAERETPAGEAMREAVARDLRKLDNHGEDFAVYLEEADYLFRPSGPIASELARLTAERDEARRDAFSLAANQCEGPMHGDDHGNSYCPKLRAAEAALTSHRADHAAEVARKDAEITRLRDAVHAAWTRFTDIAAGKVFQPRLHAAAGATEARAALAPKETTDA